uniref:Methyltransferase domain-containing protein n=2 Tax=Lygus hesperus TaxID=30085 RepID=A0A0K8T4F4_LYGHE
MSTLSTVSDSIPFNIDNLGSEINLEDTKEYIKKLGTFLVDWKWLVLTRPTHILVDKVMESHAHILGPLASLPLETHCKVPFGYKKEFWPNDLLLFLDRVCSEQLVFPFKSVVSPGKNGSSTTKITSKKLHETTRLSAFVASICSKESIKCIVDVGSGLGYVDRELCQVVDGCRIVAVESEEARCTSADAVNKDQGLADRIIQLPMKLFSSNIKEVADIVNATANGDSCLIALHACGDLTPTSLRLFEHNTSIVSAVIMSCCYHKMSSSFDKGRTTFRNFPSSEYVKSLLADGSVDSDLADVSFLRLAAESTKELWATRSLDSLTLHAQSVAFRAIIQLYEEQNGIIFKKTKRKAVKPSSRRNWKSYAEAWVSNTDSYRRSDNQLIDRNDLLKELEDFISENDIEEVVKRTMAFNTLRNCVQHLVESFVLVDRLLALKEAGFTRSSLVRVSDAAISPRSIAIVVCR